MKDYGFSQTFSLSGGTAADVVDALMDHAMDYQGRHRSVKDLAVHQMAEHVAVSGSVTAAHVGAALTVFVDFAIDFLNHCAADGERPHRLVFMPVEVTIAYDGVRVSA